MELKVTDEIRDGFLKKSFNKIFVCLDRERLCKHVIPAFGGFVMFLFSSLTQAKILFLSNIVINTYVILLNLGKSLGN